MVLMAYCRWVVPVLLISISLCTSRAANGQSIHWAHPGKAGESQQLLTLVYGEVEVWATGPTVYFCGANWLPGVPVNGYCGIQDMGDGRRRTIFTVWDTTPRSLTRFVRKSDRPEGTFCVNYELPDGRITRRRAGVGCSLAYEWREGVPFRLVLVKRPDRFDKRILTSVCFFDDHLNQWVLQATVASPIESDDPASPPRHFAALVSFLENWTGKNRDIPKLCLYRLWGGTTPEDLTYFTRVVQGSGEWGVVDGSFYLAEGDDAKLNAIVAEKRRDKDAAFRASAKPSSLPQASGPMILSERRLSDDKVDSLRALWDRDISANLPIKTVSDREWRMTNNDTGWGHARIMSDNIALLSGGFRARIKAPEGCTVGVCSAHGSDVNAYVNVPASDDWQAVAFSPTGATTIAGKVVSVQRYGSASDVHCPFVAIRSGGSVEIVFLGLLP